jgi:hypothetical protein
MCPGEKRKLTIQPDWAYGSRGVGPIPANSVLSMLDEGLMCQWANSGQSLRRSWSPSKVSVKMSCSSYTGGSNNIFKYDVTTAPDSVLRQDGRLGGEYTRATPQA